MRIRSEIERLPDGNRWDWKITAYPNVSEVLPQAFVCGGLIVAEAYETRLIKEAMEADRACLKA